MTSKRRFSHIFALPMALVVALVMCLAIWLGAPTAAVADEEHSRVAGVSEMAAERELGDPGMEPIGPMDVKEGTYPIEVESSSSFFKIVDAQLTVTEGGMEATITLRSSSYTLVFMGTGQEAAAAPASDYIPFDESTKTFTVLVEALDSNIDCAAFSKNRKKWYDRKLWFKAASLPADALLVDLPEHGSGEAASSTQDDVGDDSSQQGGAADAESSSSGVPSASGVSGASEDAPEAIPIDLPDGEYSVEVDMSGGSGRAQVSSPTWLVVKDGRAYARLLWSSPNYDYMLMDEYRYDNLTTDGSNSVFQIPITAFDEEIDVVADTTAMGDPVEIEYHLFFYSDTVGEKNLIPQEAAILVLELALVIIVVGGILNYILKKRRKQ